MSSILRQIQKRSNGSRLESVDILLRQDNVAEEAARFLDDEGDGSFRNRLDDSGTQSLVIDETLHTRIDSTSEFKTDVLPKTQVFKIIRRSQEKKQSISLQRKEDILPWWLTEGHKMQPQVDMLVDAARQAMGEVPFEKLDELDLPAEVARVVEEAIPMVKEQFRVTRKVQQLAERELLNLLKGHGPLEALFADELVTDLFIDSYDSIKVIRRGKAIETPFRFRNQDEYRLFLGALLRCPLAKLFEDGPIVDCIIDDAWKSRVSVIHSALAEGDEPRTCIRIPRLQQFSFYDLLQNKTLPATLAAWLAEAVALREINILIVGPIGSGKTKMASALLSSVASDERVVVVEELPEIWVPTPHLEKLVCRPSVSRNSHAVSIAEVVQAALRRAPHRVVVGEIDARVAAHFLRVLETGHLGSLATLRADSAEDALWHLLDLSQSQDSVPERSLIRRISRSVDLILTMQRIDGVSCLKDVSEVLPSSGEDFRTLSLVSYEGALEGKRHWRIKAEHSSCLEKLAAKGMHLTPGRGLLSPP